MADGEIRVKLDDTTVQRLEAVAEAAGQSVDAYVRDLIAERLDEGSDWAGDMAALGEYDRTGVSYSVEEAMEMYDAAVRKHFETRG